MAEIDSRIALGLQPVKINDPLETYGKGLQLRSLIDSNQLDRLKYDQAVKGAALDDSINNAYKNAYGADGTLDRQKLYSGVAQAGGGSKLPAIQKGFAETDKLGYESQLQQLKVAAQKTEQLGSLAGSALQMIKSGNVNQVASVYGQAVKQGLMSPEDARQEMGQLNWGDPNSLMQHFGNVQMKAVDALKQIELNTPKFEKVEAGNRVISGTVDPKTGEFTEKQTFKKAPEGYNLTSDGKMMIDPDFLASKKAIAQAGKTSVVVNTEKPLLTTMAEGLGKQLDSSLSGANSAVQTIKYARELNNLVDSGKLISGPLANQRINVAQIAQTFGLTGKNAEETLQNTRLAIQNLAQGELQAAASMKGQGQITEAERDILKRAASGDITLTGPELKAIATAAEKNATARIQEHKQQVGRLEKLPGGQPLMPFYSVPDIPPAQTKAAQPVATKPTAKPVSIPEGWDVKVK